jgi:hypothetical protein
MRRGYYHQQEPFVSHFVSFISARAGEAGTEMMLE